MIDLGEPLAAFPPSSRGWVQNLWMGLGSIALALVMASVGFMAPATPEDGEAAMFMAVGGFVFFLAVGAGFLGWAMLGPRPDPILLFERGFTQGDTELAWSDVVRCRVLDDRIETVLRLNLQSGEEVRVSNNAVEGAEELIGHALAVLEQQGVEPEFL